ncbi:hypothetical protein CCACVL1_22473 [Corchorus capsularis]|uniref:EF-hand domain-containing protein n=1 Tax=Corchorus capsularis TaxID=210143 RepID=A0A1R3GYP8_COCAP|nr:hypothetical protein CCACVL1_22473 [Corchorus capsularis]
MGSLANRKMYFEEFCAAAFHICHLEGVEGGEQILSAAFEHFEQEGNQVISEEELCQLNTLFECPSKSPTVDPESHLQFHHHKTLIKF